ncbi:uncharacterized protein DFL_003044 [Arthrobotrys flagrans]|uniref:Uncharacterized protein n=1 Tax=Arthrobotrys flagrans TaxID=97331 RepID=A0A437AC92_ARTFL|nr:hypothetical protein DFL_003044 [Arthrobotrys flagrans]
MAVPGEKRLFTLYHNSVAPSIPIVITPEVDTPTATPTATPDTINNNKNSFNNNQVPNMKNYYIPVTRKTSQASNPIECTINSTTAVENLLTEEDCNEITSFTEGLKDFMGDGRRTPAFGSTDNSDSGGSRQGNNERQVQANTNNGMKMLPPKEVGDDDAVAETPEFPTTRKPAVKRVTDGYKLGEDSSFSEREYSRNSKGTTEDYKYQNSSGESGYQYPRPRTPLPTSSGLKNKGRRSPSPPALVTTDVNIKAGSGANNGKRKVREKVEVVDYKKIIEDRKKKSTIPSFRSLKDSVKWLKENRSGDWNAVGEGRKLAAATRAVVNPGNKVNQSRGFK